MVKRVFKQLKKVPVPIPVVIKTPGQALRNVTSKDGLGVYASDDTLFKGAIFGRDSLEVAEDLMTLRPGLVRRVLVTLASLQGQETNEANEEEPGKILHEYRRLIVDGQLISGPSRRIFGQLANRWGDTEDELIYYGSVDSTPLFLRVLANYCELHEPEFMDERITLHDGQEKTIGQVAEAAVDWLIAKIKNSKSGLLEYQRLNPNGIANQAWKDSAEFYVHATGDPVNHDRPVASIEVQALAYDALVMAGELLPPKRLALQDEAEKLRDKTIELLWQPEQGYFALGVDYDATGRRRVIDIVTANPAEMLDSLFFDDLDKEVRRALLTALASSMVSVDFLTDAGIRSRALSEAELIDFWDYHGSFTSWPKETYDIAKGLRRQGFPRLATQLEDRLLNVIKAVRSYPEFLYVDRAGRVLGTAAAARTHGELVFVDSHNRPEKIQAWTVSAILAISTDRRRLMKLPNAAKRPQWKIDLETELMRQMPIVHRLKSRRELSARYPAYPYELKRQGGP